MRRLYQLILWAHPPAFRERFGAEMLCLFDDAVLREGELRLVVDGTVSLVRQQAFSLYMPLSRALFGGTISFALFVFSCVLMGGGRLHPGQHPSIAATETDTAQALAASDLMSISDECADCAPKSAHSLTPLDGATGGVQSRPDELPFPSGQFSIGRVSYPLPPSSSSSSELRLFVWYPASVDSDTSVPVDNVWGYSKSMDKFVQTHTIENAAIAGGTAHFPLILFAPAAGNESAAYLSQIENLVSHGYVVASLQDSDSLNAVWFQDTRLIVFATDMRRAFFFPESKKPEDVLARAESFEQVRETTESAKIRFAFDQLILIATDRSQRAPFAGRIDFERVGAFGHGSGGNAVTHLCGLDLHISACVDEDGWTPNGLAEGSPVQLPSQPFLLIEIPLTWPDDAQLTYAHISHHQFGRMARGSAVEINSKLKSLRGGAYHISLLSPGLSDKNFTDGPLVWSMKRGHIGDTNARAALAVTNVYSRTFFDKYLKGESAPLLDARANSPFPNIRVQRYGAQ